MNTYIMFRNDHQEKDHCSGEVYARFLDYAFAEADCFMLVYVNREGKGLSKATKEIRDALHPFAVKRRSDARWPGMIWEDADLKNTESPYKNGTSYRITFYKTAPEAKDVLKRVDRLCAWVGYSTPQDFAFFKGNKCWVYTVGHECLAAMLNPTDEDILFLEENGLAAREDLEVDDDGFYDAYHEKIV